MLNRAAKTFEANRPPPRTNLAKDLFPSSSPTANGDIQQMLKKPKTPGGTAVTSARIMAEAPASIANSTFGGGQKSASLSRVYGSSDPFAASIDLDNYVSTNSQSNKANQDIWIGADDLSDDENLDLDFEAPTACPKSLQPQASADVNMGPPPTQHIPWSSSPPSHWAPPARTISANTNDSGTSRTLSGGHDTSLEAHKRGAMEEDDSSEGPVLKKAKRRARLPWGKAEEPIVVDDEDEGLVARTPMRKANGFLDPTASAIKEQKRQLKNQRQPQQDSLDRNSVDVQALQDSIENHGPKSAAIHLSNEQKHVIDLVVNQGKSVFFTGPAGTGKSVLMRAIIEELKKKYAKDPERVAVTASTGLAACNIGGITLHSFSGIGLGKEEQPVLVKKIRQNSKAKNRWLKTKCLIIDEISMVDGTLFDKLSGIGREIRRNGRPWGGIQLIITGDFFQLPPVPDSGGDKKREATFAFDASTWNTSIDHTIGLTQVFRQRDPRFAQMLNEMRLGEISRESEQAFKALSRPLQFNDGVDMASLFPRREQVDYANNSRLNSLPGKAYKFEAHDTGDPQIKDRLLANMMAPKSLTLKKNAQVMLIKNMDDNLVNGSLGKVVDFSDEKTFEMMSANDYGDEMDDAMAKARKKLKAFSRDAESESTGQKFPIVQFTATDGTTRLIMCQPEDWKIELPNGDIQAKRSQLPLILAWALSIHKAQGQTLERVTVDLGKIFEKGQAYVALSRATTQEGLQVLNFSKHKVMAHPKVCEFYRRLYSAEEASAKKSGSLSDFVANKKGAAAAAW